MDPRKLLFLLKSVLRGATEVFMRQPLARSDVNISAIFVCLLLFTDTHAHKKAPAKRGLCVCGIGGVLLETRSF